MPYGFLLQLLVLGLGVHYVFTADASVRAKSILGGLLAVSVLFARWLPAFVPLSLQIVVSVYILMIYRLQGLSSE